MTFLSYLKAIRRRWKIVFASVLVATIVGFLSTIVAQTSKAPGVTGNATASAIILNKGTPDGQESGITNISTMAALTTVGEVPKMVAEELQSKEQPLALASRVKAEADTTTGLLTISATDRADRASALANAFAENLLEYARSETTKDTKQQTDDLQGNIDDLQAEVDELNTRIAGASQDEAESLRGQLQSKSSQLDLQQQQLDELSDPTNSTIPFSIIQRATKAPAVTNIPVFEGPTDRSTRLGIAVLLGLLAGIALALILDHFDTRIRGRLEAEEYFRLPVLAEIPLLRGRLAGGIVVGRAPHSAPANAFRLLAAGLSHWGRQDNLAPAPLAVGTHLGHDHGALPSEVPPPPERRGEILMVTSPERREGRSTVVANLAASFSELGKKVLVLSCDFRNPGMHQVLGVPDAPGLTDALLRSNGRVLNGATKLVSAEDISFEVVPSGGVTARPAELLGSPKMGDALAEARSGFDFVLIDTPAMLSASDATLLLSHVDQVVVVARAGRTTQDQAQRTGELLGRLESRTVGVVLNAVSETPLSGQSWRDRIRGFPRIARHPKGK